MLCRYPYIPKEGGAFPCGRCIPCRVAARRLWTHRIMLESDCHEASSFVTLTYNPENFPSDGSLNPEHLQLWKKRLRIDYFRKTGKLLRFYCVGEYGDKTFRPHYHAIVFGYSSCLNPYRKKWLRKKKKPCDCDNCVMIHDSWGLGFTDCGDVSLASAGYVAGYINKKMTKKDDSRLEGRYPEFCQNRAKPGIGQLAVAEIADSLLNKETGEVYLDEFGDVPRIVKRDGRFYPLGRYIRGKLREKLGVADNIKEEAHGRWKTEVSELRKNYLASKEKVGSFKEYLASLDSQKAAKVENLYKRSLFKTKELDYETQ
ncbi:MAG: replication initiator protein [Arizlama microvirus]|nr:MAG: replication initiator protein [Arizlama microvirus]